MSIFDILSHTPTWVWILLAFLIYRGFSATRPREVAPARLLIIPAVFLVWGLSGLWSAEEAGFARFALFAVGAALGFALGWVLAAVIPAPRWEERRGMLAMPGSWAPLVIILLAFLSKYVGGVALATSADPSARAGIAAALAGIGGLFAGLFWGRTLGQFRRALIAGGLGGGMAELAHMIQSRKA